MGESVIDPDLLVGFLDESLEALGTVGSLFINLEQNPQNIDTIQAIFRPIHSLKGNASFFGLLSIKRVAHEMETLLDLLRTHKLQASRQCIDALLAGSDLLQQLLEGVRTQHGDISHPEENTVLARITSCMGSEGRSPSKDLELLRSYLPPDDPDISQALKRLAIALGCSDESGAEDGEASTHSNNDPLLSPLIARLEAARAGRDSITEDELHERLNATLIRCTEHPKAAAIQEAIKESRFLIETIGIEEVALDFLLDQLRPCCQTPAPTESSANGNDGPIASVSSKGRAPQNEAKTMRVPEQAIDTFLHYVGELVVVGDMFRHLHTMTLADPALTQFAKQFRRANETFANLSNQLQKSIMSIRKVSLKPVAQKFPRLVRDLSTKLGKDVQLVIEGDDLHIDKSLVDLLDAPLTHMIRNSLDHGLESPEERVEQGKEKSGTVLLRFTQEGGHFTVSVSDDGRGLNLEAIRQKAEGLGLIAAGATLGEQDIVNLLFASGVSTAAAVTEVSGRGVGMDVVRRAIEDAGGHIGVSTQMGQGSTFRIVLPMGVTTQIVGGYLVECGGHSYVLPLDRVRETFRCRPDQMRSTGNGRQGVVRRGQVIGIQDLSTLLGHAPPDPGPKGLPVVIIESNKRLQGLQVSGVLGVHKVVIRSLDGLSNGAPMVSGAALLGDGRLALVVDLDRLAVQAVDASVLEPLPSGAVS